MLNSSRLEESGLSIPRALLEVDWDEVKRPLKMNVGVGKLSNPTMNEDGTHCSIPITATLPHPVCPLAALVTLMPWPIPAKPCAL